MRRHAQVGERLVVAATEERVAELGMAKDADALGFAGGGEDVGDVRVAVAGHHGGADRGPSVSSVRPTCSRLTSATVFSIGTTGCRP